MPSKKSSRSLRKAKNVEERCEQILNWLKAERPCGRQVVIKWVTWAGKKKRDQHAETNRHGNSLVISMNRPKCRMYEATIDTLFHEYGHCTLWGLASLDSTYFEKSDAQLELIFHNSTYWAEYGSIYNMFHYLDGWRDSKDYEF